MLWFDVEKNGYTTEWLQTKTEARLWFDVEKNGYTTIVLLTFYDYSCGLM